MAAIDKRSIWFWQNIISPHMAGLAAALAHKGCDVTYVAQQGMSDDRTRQGWHAPSLRSVSVRMMDTRTAVRALVASAPERSIHICGGVRSNGLIKIAQRLLAGRSLRQWVLMETVDDAGFAGAIKRIEYARLFRIWRARLQGVLAIGQRTPKWVVARGMPEDVVFPFAYFLPGHREAERHADEATDQFRLVFVGQLIERKRLGLLIRALEQLAVRDFHLSVVGTGPLEQSVRALAADVLPGKVSWLGSIPMKAVPKVMADADCLILPSRHDGWGAVISEALMVGTPVICSDACGAAGVVLASGQGRVFRRDDQGDLKRSLERVMANGRLSSAERESLANWAMSLGTDAGAAYLLEILEYVDRMAGRPVPPWEGDSRSAV